MDNVKQILIKHKYWTISSVILFIVFLSFMQMDLLETSYQGYIMAQGNVFDFYEATAGAAYLPSTYILFAIWNLPVALFSFLSGTNIGDLGYLGTRVFLYWNKLLPVIFYVGCTFYIYKIMLEVTKKKKLAQLTAFAFFTAPIAIYSQFIFGQYDSFMVFFCLGGIYYFCKHDLLKFTLFFAVSITFKYTVVVLYLPLLLMSEKRVLHLLKHVCMLVVPVVLELVLFKSPSSATNFVSSKLEYITGTTVSNPYFSIQIVVLLFVLLCAYAYFNDKINQKNTIHWAMFYCNISVFLLFGLSAWHPQWMLLAIPFWVISTYLNKNADMFMFINVLMMGFFVFYVSQNWRGIADQELLRLGMFGQFLEYHGNYKTISEFLPKILSQDTCFTVLSALMLIQVIFKHPKYAEEYNTEGRNGMRNAFLVFLGGLGVFLIPCTISTISLLKSEKVPVNIGEDYISVKSKIDENYNLAQIKQLVFDDHNLETSPFAYEGEIQQLQEYFINLSEHASKLTIPLVNENEATYTIEISNDKGEILYSGSENGEEGILTFDIRSANLKKGDAYHFEIKSSDGLNSLFQTNYAARSDLSHGMINGQRQEFDIVFKIIEY